MHMQTIRTSLALSHTMLLLFRERGPASAGYGSGQPPGSPASQAGNDPPARTNGRTVTPPRRSGSLCSPSLPDLWRLMAAMPIGAQAGPAGPPQPAILTVTSSHTFTLNAPNSSRVARKEIAAFGVWRQRSTV